MAHHVAMTLGFLGEASPETGFPERVSSGRRLRCRHTDVKQWRGSGQRGEEKGRGKDRLKLHVEVDRVEYDCRKGILNLMVYDGVESEDGFILLAWSGSAAQQA